MKSSKKKSNRILKFVSRTFVSIAYIFGNGSICVGWWGEEDCPKELFK